MIKNKLAPFLAAVLTFFWMLYFFHDVFRYPNAHLFNEQGDGIKAFYVFADHVKNDESYHQERNMNYPYGQTHIYTDGQTVIANGMKLLTKFIPALENRTIGVYNLLIIWSFVLCGFFSALLLQRFGAPFLFSVFGGLCITVLSPQIWRISAHPTMAYAFFFPLSWYLLLKAIDSNLNWKYFLLCLLNTTFWFFVHPYLGMIITFFYAAFFLVDCIKKRSRKLFRGKKIAVMLLLTFLPLLLVKIYTLKYDHHEFRSEYPWGFWTFNTAPAQVFLPHSLPFGPATDFFFGEDTQNWEMEKLAYVGLAVDFILLLIIWRMLRKIFRKKLFQAFNPPLPRYLNASFWAAFLVLLFSMSFPFNLGMESLVNHVSFLRQFRSLGRFAWAFYYVAAIYAIYFFFLVYRYLKMKKLGLLANTMAVCFFSLFILEGKADYVERSFWALFVKNHFNSELITPEDKGVIDEVNKIKENYQCLITLPFFHVGTENFGINYTSKNIGKSMIVSYWCNMPLLASYAARSPIQEGKNIMQFFSPAFIYKSIQNDLPSKKDFLILYTKEPLNPDEKRLLENSIKLFDNGTYELWSVAYSSIFDDNTNDLFSYYNSVRNSLTMHGSFQVNREPDLFEYFDFDSLKSEVAYQGKGSLKANKKNMTVLFSADGKLKADQEYTVSFWYYNKGELRNQILCGVEECFRDTDVCKWDITWSPMTSMVIDGDWSLVGKTFSIKDSTEHIRVFVKNTENMSQDIYIDEFLFRPANVNAFKMIVSNEDSTLFQNNWWISRIKKEERQP